MKLAGFAVTVFMSFLMVAFTPMSSVVHAQSASDTAALSTLKQKAMDEINRRIANLQNSIQGLSYDVLSGTTSPTATPALTTKTTTIPDGAGDQIKTFAQKMVDELKSLLTKVASASSLTDMQKLADNVNSQFSLNQVTDVQASATQSIDSMSSVYSQLTSTLSSIKSQVAKLRACTSDSSDATSTSSSSSDCSGLNTSNASSVLGTSDSQLSSISTIVSTIGSVLTSAITLLITLLPTFTSMLSGLGGAGSIGNISNLGSMSDLSSLTSSAGSLTGILSSFTAIISQLDIGNGMSGGAFSSLTSLSSLINI